LITIAIQPLIITSNNQVIIDRIEIIPITQSVLDETENQNLESEREVVNALFTNDAKDALNIGTTDYDIDQAANLVECISEELYPKEKMLLLDEVKNAKQLSQSRNVLQNGDFESATLGWTTSDNITIQEDDPIFKGHYLHMSGARDIDGTIFPTYIFQKIDESKLKPYTRYLVRGFVGSSKDVELVVSRYGEEIDAIMNVPADLNYLYPSTFDCEGSNRCETSAVPANIGNTSDMLYSCQYDTGKKHVVCQDSHQFSFTIDTGALDTNENIGVWVMFKISSPDGYASLDNLEVIEEGPIDGEALSRVKHMEKKWNDQMEAKR
ncbi:toxin Cry1Ac domain D-VI-related protein, partial [Bacillus thuringiensis]